MNDYILGQPEPPRARLGARFAVFGLIIVLVVGAADDAAVLSAGRAAAATTPVSPRTNRARRSADRGRARPDLRPAGPPAGDNVPVVRRHASGPATCPFTERDRVVERLSTLLSMPGADIIEALDRNAEPALRPRAHRDATCPSDVARVIAEERRDLPGVDVDVEARREYLYGPLVSHVLGCTGPGHGRRPRRAQATRATWPTT